MSRNYKSHNAEGAWFASFALVNWQRGEYYVYSNAPGTLAEKKEY